MANQGIYHPTYNSNGSKKLSDDNFWYNTSVSINSTMDCFDSSKMLVASGNIGTTSGRPDGTFYDQIVENSILDLRNSSKKVEDYNRLITREFNRLIAGTTRGKEGERFTERFGKLKLQTTSYSVYGSTAVRLEGVASNYIFGNATSIIHGSSVYFEHIGFIKGNTKYYKVGYINSASTSVVYLSPEHGNVTSDFTASVEYEVIACPKTTRTKSNTLLHCDIIGNPTNYPTSWKDSGVFGTPLLIAEDGTSLLPDGTRDTFKLSRKANAAPLLCLRSTDSGATWTSFTPTFSTTTNAITLTDEPAGNIVLVYYQTKTTMATPTVNSEVVEMIGEASFISYFNKPYGSDLLYSLIAKVSVSTIEGSFVQGYKLSGYFIEATLNNVLVKNMSKFYPKHEIISPVTITSPTAKVFPYLTRLNGKAYLNLVFKEMKYGSYLAPTVVTAASATYTQNMTYKINIAGCALDGKVIKWIGATTTSAIDWSLYDVSPTGVIYLLSSGVVYNNAKLYDGDSWGDDGKFNIVDNVSTTTDDNGQTVLIGQKTVELPYFIDAGE